mmetsp:Transcript_22480/g.69757  ORF Transcript_22480/g.69757 Transcript_22480/m.69757 type:complete len:251 (-) Transcript_22480:30-782(-)
MCNSVGAAGLTYPARTAPEAPTPRTGEPQSPGWELVEDAPSASERADKRSPGGAAWPAKLPSPRGAAFALEVGPLRSDRFAVATCIGVDVRLCRSTSVRVLSSPIVDRRWPPLTRIGGRLEALVAVMELLRREWSAWNGTAGGPPSSVSSRSSLAFPSSSLSSSGSGSASVKTDDRRRVDCDIGGKSPFVPRRRRGGSFAAMAAPGGGGRAANELRRYAMADGVVADVPLADRRLAPPEPCVGVAAGIAS